jgi:hypothetical protein
MYSVKYSEKYDDSYAVDDYTQEEFNSINEASNGFKKITIDLLNDPLIYEKIVP